MASKPNGRERRRISIDVSRKTPEQARDDATICARWLGVDPELETPMADLVAAIAVVSEKAERLISLGVKLEYKIIVKGPG